jgi:preprotein translocase subunit SecE
VNRQTKRLLQKQGQMTEDGTPTAATRRAPAATRPRAEAEKPSIGKRFGEYLREVRNELAKVAWPPRTEVVRYSSVVFVTLVFLVLLIYGLNFAFEHLVLKLYGA